MKKILKRLLRRLGRAGFAWVHQEIKDTIERQSSAETQLLLYHMFREMAGRENAVLPRFAEVEFRCHSQFGEDGILLYLFAVIGTTDRTVVEICAGDGIECNSANLILNHGWWGHLFDGNERNVLRGRKFYAHSRDTWLYPPRFSHCWISAENVNDVIRGSGVEGSIDLLSLDIDGMDYWVWQAIDCIRPRVVVCETHGIVGPDDALTVPYDPDFRIQVTDYHSASLAAMTKLANQKDYRLVGTHRFGFNAFFVRNGIGENLLPAVSPADCLTNPFTADSHATRWPKVMNMKWVRV